MSYISGFTNDIRHLHGDQNVVANALSRVEINDVKFFQEGLNYNEIAKAQQDTFIKSLIENPSKSSLKISEVKVEDSDQVILCDVSTDKVRPIIPEQFQKVVFDKIHNLAHSSIKATRNLRQRTFIWKNMKKKIVVIGLSAVFYARKIKSFATTNLRKASSTFFRVVSKICMLTLLDLYPLAMAVDIF